jgi:photosystem II stability/assembly factor-like uncharacterized protein
MPNELHVATRKGLFVYTRGPKGLAQTAVHFLGDPVTMTLDDPRDGTIYAALNLGHFGVKLRRSDDRGRTWTEIAVPVYPPQPEGLPEAEQEKPGWWTLRQIWALEAADPAKPGSLWAGTLPGGLFRSDDRGDSWTLVRSLWDRAERRRWFGGGYEWPGIHSILVDPRDARHVTVGVSCGGVWTSRDAGGAWELIGNGMFAAYMPPEQRGDPAIQDPHRVVSCPARPDALWAQHHNGVFRSTDGGRTFTEVATVKPSVFGFAVAVHPADPDTAWLVPAVKDECRVPVEGKFVVARTHDGGRTFTTLDRGLPAHGYDLVYRHGLDIDGTGQSLAMGSTTGSLWLTEDGGDAWSALSEHLPPIYAVRFAA